MTEQEKQKWKSLRLRARTDLYWLAKEVLGYDALIERVHRPVCEFFVQKNPALPFPEQDTQKERLLLDPRGHFKTTLDVADIVQWILNFPNIRILIMTGKRELAELMLKEVKAHFQHNDKLRKLFPEFAPPQDEDFGNTEEFTIPTRTLKHLKEPTVMVSSGGSVKAGFHFDVIKCDDLVNEENIGTAEQLQKTIDRWNYVTPLLEPYGYRDTIGTPYDYSDLYGWLQENRKDVKVFRRAVGDIVDGKLTNLLFPERFTTEWLENQRKADPYIFNCQYMCDPTPTDTATFTEDGITRATIPGEHIQVGRIFVAWDFSFTQKSYSDYSVGAVGLYDRRGRLFIIDLVVGRFTSHQLIQQIITLYLKWRPARIGIEDAAGSRLLEPGLIAFSQKHKIYLPIDWLPVKQGKDAKIQKIASLESLLKQGKLFFAKHLPHYAELMKQFVRFPRFKHDDIPDAISNLLAYQSSVDLADGELPSAVIAAPVYDDGLLGAGLIG